MSSSFKADDLPLYVSVFNAFKDSRDRLNSGQFLRIMVALGIDGGEDTARKILMKINEDGDAVITRAEFLRSLKQPGINSTQLRLLKQIFDIFDEDRNGWASNEDVIKVLPELGLTEEEVTSEIMRLDEDKDGKIQFEDFIRVQLKI